MCDSWTIFESYCFVEFLKNKIVRSCGRICALHGEQSFLRSFRQLLVKGSGCSLLRNCGPCADRSLGITWEAGYHNWFVGTFLKLIIISIDINNYVPGIRVWPLKQWSSQPYLDWGLNRDNTESRSFRNLTESLRVLFQFCMSMLLSSKHHFL